MAALEALTDAASALQASTPLIIAFFTFKGGVGKTTLCHLLAYTLAASGFNILLIDADRQCNLTLHFQDNPKQERDHAAEADEASSDEEDEAGNLQQALQAGAKKFAKQLLEQQASGRIHIPDIEGDALPAPEELVPLSSDYLILAKDEYDDLVGALSDFISGKPRDLKLRQVQAGLYDSEKQTGTLHLLKGTRDFSSLDKDFSSEGSNKWQAMAAFRKMVLHGCKQVGAHFALVDMGPSTDVVNRTFATSADVIQPCACPDSFSWSGGMTLFTDVLPDWLGWWTQHKFDEKQQQNHQYNKSFPQIMVFMAMQYEWNARGKVINWSDANFIRSLEDGFNEVKNLVENGHQGSGSDDVEHMENVWERHLQSKLQDDAYKQKLKLIFSNKFVHCGEGQVVVPLLRKFKHMAMCHELGMAMFDITKEAIRDYLYAPGTPLPHNAASKVNKAYNAVRKEAQVMWTRMAPLAHAYLALLLEHNSESAKSNKRSRTTKTPQPNKSRRSASARGATRS